MTHVDSIIWTIEFYKSNFCIKYKYIEKYGFSDKILIVKICQPV